MKYTWINNEHKKKLVEARALLVQLIEGPVGDMPTFMPVLNNTDEHEKITDIIRKIEHLLGY